MEPTRELAKQVTAELTRLVPNIHVATIYGGVDYAPQTQLLNRGVDVLVATPGRLVDHMERGNLNLGLATECVVLDEADEMLRIGFTEQVEQVMRSLPTQRQVDIYAHLNCGGDCVCACALLLGADERRVRM
jgi:superfamily II DNA/RNA helicase